MMNGPRTRNALKQILLHVALGIGAIVMLVPFIYMVVAALTPERLIFTDGIHWSEFGLQNFQIAWERAPWLTYYRNGLVTVAAVFICQVALCLPAGFALAKHQFFGKKTIWALVIVALLIPPQITAIPNYLVITRLGLLDTLTALILPSIASAFGVFLFRQYILNLPDSLLEAAWLDGVGPIAVVWRIVLPSVRPAIAALAVFSVVGHWNDLFWPSVVVRSDASATVPYGIALFNDDVSTQYGPLMASACLAVVPLVIIFLLLQRNFVRGISLTSTH